MGGPTVATKTCIRLQKYLLKNHQLNRTSYFRTGDRHGGCLRKNWRKIQREVIKRKPTTSYAVVQPNRGAVGFPASIACLRRSPCRGTSRSHPKFLSRRHFVFHWVSVTVKMEVAQRLLVRDVLASVIPSLDNRECQPILVQEQLPIL